MIILNLFFSFSASAQISRNRDYYTNTEQYEITNLFFNVLDINWDKGLVAYQQIYQVADIVSPDGDVQTPCDCKYVGWDDYSKIGIIYGVYDLNKGKVLKDFYVLKSVYDLKDCTSKEVISDIVDDFLDYCKSSDLRIIWGEFEPFTDMNRYFGNNNVQFGDIYLKGTYVNNSYDGVGYTLGDLYINSEVAFSINQKESHIMGSAGKYLFERVYSKGNKYFLFYEYFWESGFDAPNLTVFDFTPFFKIEKKNQEIIDAFTSLPEKFLFGAKYLLDDENLVLNVDKYYLKGQIDFVPFISDFVFEKIFLDKNVYLLYQNYYDPEEEPVIQYSKIKILSKFNTEWQDVTNDYMKGVKTEFPVVDAIKFYPEGTYGEIYNVKSDKADGFDKVFFFNGQQFYFFDAKDMIITSDKVGRIGKGMTIEQIRKLFPNLNYREEIDDDSQGTMYYFETYNDVFDLFAPVDRDDITFVQIYSPIFYTEKGINTYSTLEDLKRAYPDLKVDLEEDYYEMVYNARTKELPNVVFCFNYIENDISDNDVLGKITVYFD